MSTGIAFFIYLTCIEKNNSMKITNCIILFISAILISSCGTDPIAETIEGTWEIISFEAVACNLSTEDPFGEWYQGDIEYNETDENGCIDSYWGIGSVLAPSCNIILRINSKFDVKLEVTDLLGERLILDYHYGIVPVESQNLATITPVFGTSIKPAWVARMDKSELVLTENLGIPCDDVEMRFSKI